jgi:hypothetical protein
MHNINNQKDIDGIIINLITLHKERHEAKISCEHKCISSGDPPVDSSPLWCLCVEIPLNDLSGESALLASCLNTNVGYTEKDTIYHDKTLGS